MRIAILTLLLLVARASAQWAGGVPGCIISPSAVRDGAHLAVALAQDRLWSDGRTRVMAADVSGFPQLSTRNHLLAALYRMACEEALASIRTDGALMAGREWPGVWTRDVSYATHLAMAFVLPQAARASLAAKTFSGRVRQDTGTGGAWPVSTDRAVWALAARELWLATGDAGIRDRALVHVERMALEDLAIARDPDTGLMRGETSFLDWREQTYPPWMEPVDIFMSCATSTNLLHAAVYRAIADFRADRREPAPDWLLRERSLTAAIRARLRDRHGRYASYLFPDGSRTPQIDALANALAIVTGVASPAEAPAILASYPITGYGIPTIWPQQAHPEKPYHNKAVWPFVQAYWGLAAARTGHLEAYRWSLAAMTRAAASFLTHKENFVHATGRAEGTAINSDRQLWSVAGWLAMVYRGLFGVWLSPGGITFRPAVPAGLGDLALRGLRIRGAVLDLRLSGHGTVLRRLIVDGRPWDPRAPLPYLSPGHHGIELELAPDPDAPEPMTVRPIGVDDVEAAPARSPGPRGIAIGLPGGAVHRWNGPGKIDVPLTIDRTGRYRIRARYANGNGPINTDSRCGLRSLIVDGRRVGALVMPQRGLGSWTDFGLSSAVRVDLAAGPHVVRIAHDATCATMDPAENRVSIVGIELTRQDARNGAGLLRGRR